MALMYYIEYLYSHQRLINYFGAETGIFLGNYVNTMAADALATCVARSSATMVLTTQDKQVLVFHEEGLQLTTPSLVLPEYSDLHRITVKPPI